MANRHTTHPNDLLSREKQFQKMLNYQKKELHDALRALHYNIRFNTKLCAHDLEWAQRGATQCPEIIANNNGDAIGFRHIRNPALFLKWVTPCVQQIVTLASPWRKATPNTAFDEQTSTYHNTKTTTYPKNTHSKKKQNTTKNTNNHKTHQKRRLKSSGPWWHHMPPTKDAWWSSLASPLSTLRASASHLLNANNIQQKPSVLIWQIPMLERIVLHVKKKAWRLLLSVSTTTPSVHNQSPMRLHPTWACNHHRLHSRRWMNIVASAANLHLCFASLLNVSSISSLLCLCSIPKKMSYVPLYHSTNIFSVLHAKPLSKIRIIVVVGKSASFLFGFLTNPKMFALYPSSRSRVMFLAVAFSYHPFLASSLFN